MMNPTWRNWLGRLSQSAARLGRRSRPSARSRWPWRPQLEKLEDRTLPSVTIASTNNNGKGYTGLDFNQSGGYVPPDTQAAAGPTNVVETVNQELAIYTPKATGATKISDSLNHFWSVTGGLPFVDGSQTLSDPVVTYDDNMPGQTAATGRFIIGDQNLGNGDDSVFDIAVSTTANPTDLSAANWNFYQIRTTEAGFSADYPGNLGFNNDAFVFTLNQFGNTGGGHVEVTSVNATDLVNGVPQSQLHFYQNDLGDFSVRPTTMHNAASGAPMWLVTDTGDGQHITVYEMTNVLSNSANFTRTDLAVHPYANVVAPLNPNGTAITRNIDARIQKSAMEGNTLVAAQAVSLGIANDSIQWYVIDTSSGTPVLSQQGDVNLGIRTYAYFPAIDISPSGNIGLTYMKSGNDSLTDFMSMYVTGRTPSDPTGTMETPVEVPAGTGQANYSGGGRAGDLGGINIDPNDGSFWAANEFANKEAGANWGTAIANFSLGAALPTADTSVTNAGPSQVTAGTSATYTITVGNLGPNPANNLVLTDTLPAGSSFVMMNQTGGTDTFTFAQNGGTVTETANANIASGSTDSFSLIVFAPTSLGNGAAFNDTASVSSNNTDPNPSNNTSTVSGTVVNTSQSADLGVTNSGAASASEGQSWTYTLTVTNAGPNAATGTTLTDTLPAQLKFLSATSSQGTFSQSNGVVTFSLGTVNANATATATVVVQAIEDGSIGATASVSSNVVDPNPSNNTANATTAVSEPAIVVSPPIQTTAQRLTNALVASFTHANGVEPTSAFVATINWGDNTTSTGSIVQVGTTYHVFGSHTYGSAGTHTITTTVVEPGNGAESDGLQLKLSEDDGGVLHFPLGHIVGPTGGGQTQTALPSQLAPGHVGTGTASGQPASLAGFSSSVLVGANTSSQPAATSVAASAAVSPSTSAVDRFFSLGAQALGLPLPNGGKQHNAWDVREG